MAMDLSVNAVLLKFKYKKTLHPLERDERFSFRGTTQISTKLTLLVQKYNNFDTYQCITVWLRLSLLSFRISVRNSEMFFKIGLVLVSHFHQLA